MNGNKDVIARFVALGVVLVNTILSACGINPIPFSQDEVYIVVSALLTCGVAIYTAWKNNSVTSAAKTSDKVMKAIQNGIVTIDAIDDLLETAEEEFKKHNADNE